MIDGRPDILRVRAMYFSGYYFRLFAEECLACAREATTAERRNHHLAMADMWNRVAARQERDNNECAR